MADQSLFGSLRVAGQLLEVPMDDSNILLPSSGKQAIGTRGLNGCSCVVFMGSTAIVLAHISPFPGRATGVDPNRDLIRESHEHHKAALTAVADLVRQQKHHFRPSATAWGIFSWCKEDGHLRSVKDQVQTHLKDMSYEMSPAFYVTMDVHTIVPPKGELVALFRNSVAELWLERRRLWPMPQQQNTIIRSSALVSPARQLQQDGAPNIASSYNSTQNPKSSVSPSAYRASDGRIYPRAESCVAAAGRCYPLQQTQQDEEDNDDDDDDDEGEESPTVANDWVWDTQYNRCRRLVNGEWQWGPQ